MNGSHAAIIAAQQRRKELEKQDSEEEMSNYHSDDLAQYEFKIVRSSANKLSNPDIFQRLLKEEALAGWELLEKLDHKRARFKRDKTLSRKDFRLPPELDPYRTEFEQSRIHPMIIVFAGLIALGSTATFFWIFGQTAMHALSILEGYSDTPISMAYLGVLMILVGGIKLKFRK